MTTPHAQMLAMLNLHRGRHNAIPLPKLAYFLRTSTREVQNVKRELILDGYQIGSACGSKPGIYMIVDEEDRRVAAKQIRNRIISLAKVLRTYDKSRWVLELCGQLEMLNEMEG